MDSHVSILREDLHPANETSLSNAGGERRDTPTDPRKTKSVGCGPSAPLPLLLEVPSSADYRGTAGAGEKSTADRGGDLRRCYTTQPTASCGIDLHARTMSVCLLNQAGEILGPQHIKASPETCLKVMTPYRDDRVVAVACLCTWYGVADRCRREGLTCVLGHALDMKALHGGKAKHDTIDAHTIAVLLRGGMLPQASVYLRQVRAPRDLRRRRTHLARRRGELLAHVHNTTSS
jgi:hypothetical protein